MVPCLDVAGPEPEPSLQGGQDRNQAPEDFGVHAAEVCVVTKSPCCVAMVA